MEINELVARALAHVRRNITEHIFLEIQRNIDLFRAYVNLVSGDDEAKYGEVNRQIGLSIESTTGGIPTNRADAHISTLIQTFTCFDPETVHV